MTVVSCLRCSLKGRTAVGYRTTMREPCRFAPPGALANGGGPSIRVDVDLCSGCRSDAAKENSAAISRRQGRDSTPPGFGP